jgi:hypothetical protein
MKAQILALSLLASGFGPGPVSAFPAPTLSDIEEPSDTAKQYEPLFRGQPARTFHTSGPTGDSLPTLTGAFSRAAIGTILPTAAFTAVLFQDGLDDGRLIMGLVLGIASGFGPSWGQFYAQSPGYAWLGVGVRGLGSTLAAVGAINVIDADFCQRNNEGLADNEKKSCSDAAGKAELITGLGLYAAGTAFSLVETGFAVGRRKEPKRPAKFGWSPTLVPDQAGFTPGASAWMRF